MSENPQQDKERHYLEEERWKTKDQIRDWLLLALMVAITIGWNLLIYFLEPGLR